jgi:hypothetical protein
MKSMRRFDIAANRRTYTEAASPSRLGVLALLVLMLVTAGARAEDLVGHWSGRIEPTNLSAQIDLDLRHTGAAWEASLNFRAGPDGGPLPIDQLQVDDGDVVIRTRIEDADVTLTLTLEDALLLGTVRVTESGRVLAEGPAGLARTTSTGASHQLLRWLSAGGESLDPQRRAATIQRAIELLLTNYVLRDRAELAAADVRARVLRHEYDSVATPARLAEILGRHLSDATGDRHVQLKVGAQRTPDPFAATEESEAELARLRDDAAAGNGIAEPQILDGNIGYLAFERFYRAELAGDALASAMRELADTDALILDLRDSRGGDPSMVVLAASWFFDGRPRHWNDIRRRHDESTTQFWTAAWLPGPRYVGKEIYVLIAQRTFSAPESLAFELQQTKRATIVGEASGGGAHSGAWFPLDDRISMFIPLSQYVSAVSGGDWEGTGVQPDVACDAAAALDCAHRLALRVLGRHQSMSLSEN